MQLEQVNDIIEIVDDAAGIVRRISALEAYRKYSWIKDAPIANSVGNYRGMVISAKWKTVYLYSGSVLEKTGNILILLSVVDELMKSREKIASIVHGTDDRVTKAAKLSSQVSGIALRVIAHSALETISALNWGLRVTRWANIGFWLDQKQFMETLASVDGLCRWLNAQTDFYLSGDSVYYFTTLVAYRQ